jgi:hypothetical protein
MMELKVRVFKAAASVLAMISLMTSAYAKPLICPTVTALSQFEFQIAKQLSDSDKRWEVSMPPHRFETDNDWRFTLRKITADSAEEAIQKGNALIKNLVEFFPEENKTCFYLDMKSSIYGFATVTTE